MFGLLGEYKAGDVEVVEHPTELPALPAGMEWSLVEAGVDASKMYREVYTVVGTPSTDAGLPAPSGLPSMTQVKNRKIALVGVGVAAVALAVLLFTGKKRR